MPKQPKSNTIEKDDWMKAEKKLLQDDLEYVSRTVLDLGDHLEEGHDRLFNFLATSKKKRKLILTPRETFKTTIVSVGYTIQRILKNHNITCLLSSYIQSNAVTFLRAIKHILENNKSLQQLYGKFESDKWTESEIIVAQRTAGIKTPTVSVAGADTATTSQHYDLIIADDLVNRKSTGTMEQIEKTERHFSDLFDLSVKNTGEIIIIGTRWDGRDLYGKIIEKHKQDFDILELMATEDGRVDGRQLYPVIYPKPTMEELLRTKGSYDFYLQIMNTVTSSDTQIFRPPVREWHSLPEEMFQAITVDPAISKKKDSCDAVVMNSGLSKSGQIYAIEYKVFAEQEKHPKNILDKIIEYHIKYGTRVVAIEANGYQEVLCMLLQDKIDELKLTLDVIPIHNDEDKARRIICLQPFWENGNMLLKPGMIELQNQFDTFRKPIIAKCDIIDTLAMRLTIPKEYVTFTTNKRREGNLIYAHPRDLEAIRNMNSSKNKNPYEGKALTEQDWLARQRQFSGV